MSRTRNLILIALFAALIAAGAFLRVPIPFLPFTLQILFTTLAGILLGSRAGAFSVLVYILLGLFGLPVFVSGGGPAYIVQPTFGYLIGFCLGAYVTGRIVESRPNPSFRRLLAAVFAGLALIYALGLTYYWMIYTFYVGTGIGFWTLFVYCFLLVVPGDILLCVLAAYLGKRLLPIVRERKEERV